LDLLLVSAEASPPVCRIIDFGHFRYEQQKKEKKAKKSFKGHIIKELKMSPNISEHDYQVKIKSATKFLEKGYKVKATLQFRGREITHPELGEEKIKKFVDDMKNIGVPDGDISKTGKFLIVILTPK
jgi:translation initiation factor IF-3